MEQTQGPGGAFSTAGRVFGGGRQVLFLTALGQVQTHGVYVASLDGGEPTRVLAAETPAAYAPPGYLLRVSQGVLVAQAFDAARAAVAGEPIPVAQAVGTDDGLLRSAFSDHEVTKDAKNTK